MKISYLLNYEDMVGVKSFACLPFSLPQKWLGNSKVFPLKFKLEMVMQ